MFCTQDVNQLSLRPLCENDVLCDYLPLRYQVFRDNGWILPFMKDHTQLLDGYDAYSSPFGIYHDQVLIGAIRIVYASEVRRLPSHSYIPSPKQYAHGGMFAEISRAVVAINYRKVGLFHILNLVVNAHAVKRGCAALFISGPKDRKFEEYWTRLGFSMINTGFHYEDEGIHPDCLASSYCCILTESKAEFNEDDRRSVIAEALAKAAQRVLRM